MIVFYHNDTVSNIFKKTKQLQSMKIETIDIVIIALYLIGITAFGIWVGYRKKASSEQYFLAINKIPMTFAPAVTTVFVMGVLWKRGTKQGAMATLYLGSLLGLAYFIIDMPSMGKYFADVAAFDDYAGLLLRKYQNTQPSTSGRPS